MAIDVGDFPDGVRAYPVVSAKFIGKFRQPLCASLVKFAASLADPPDFEFARWVVTFEKISANGVRQQKCSGMSSALKAFFESGMKDDGVIKNGRPADAAFGKGVGVGMKAHGRNLGALKPDREERVGRFEMKDCGARGRAGAQHVFERGVEGYRLIDEEKLDAAAAKGIGIARYQLPMMLFAAKAQDGHARMTI